MCLDGKTSPRGGAICFRQAVVTSIHRIKWGLTELVSVSKASLQSPSQLLRTDPGYCNRGPVCSLCPLTR